MRNSKFEYFSLVHDQRVKDQTQKRPHVMISKFFYKLQNNKTQSVAVETKPNFKLSDMILLKLLTCTVNLHKSKPILTTNRFPY